MEEDEEEAIPLPNVNAAILKKVIQWCTYHKDDPPPPEDDENKEKRTDDIGTWDMEFLKVDQGTLFELILVRITNFIKFALLFLIHISFKKYVTLHYYSRFVLFALLKLTVLILLQRYIVDFCL